MKFTDFNFSFRTFLVIVFIAVFNVAVTCQIKPQDGSTTKLEDIEIGDLPFSFSLLGADNCEGTRRGLEQVFDEATKQQTKDAYLMIIMRLGKGERASRYESRRKHMEAWTKRYYGERYIIARGNPSVDSGRAEIFVNGKLFSAIDFKWNHKYICTGDLGY